MFSKHLQPSTYEEQIYYSVINPGDVCFDIGANKGDVSLYLAKLTGETGLVVSFEPIWPLYTELCKNIHDDKVTKSLIIPINLGMSNQEKEATIHVPNGDFAMGSIAEPDAWKNAQSQHDMWGKKKSLATLDTFTVQLTTIDKFIDKTGIAVPDFIKIDVEGAELLVLQGAKNWFSGESHPIMLIEVFAPWEKAFNYQPGTLLTWLQEFGYSFLFACPEGLLAYTPTADKPFPPQFEKGYNVLAYLPIIHADRIVRIRKFVVEILSMFPPPMPNHIDELNN